MSRQHLRLLTIATTIGLSLPAYSQQYVPVALVASAEKGELTPMSGASSDSRAARVKAFDVRELDPEVSACENLNDFVNTRWVIANPIPADHVSWGAFSVLAERSLNTQREIVELSARNAGDATANSITQKIGWLYASGMDSAAIEKAGVDPIKHNLAKIDGLKNSADVIDFLDEMAAEGDGMVFGFGSNADFHNAKIQIGYATQGGLGLPTKDYYTKPQYKHIRDAYVAYISRSLRLIGVPAVNAKQQADRVMKFETSLAAASLSPTEARDLDNQYHFVSVMGADKVTPHFSWEKFFAAQGVTVDQGFSLSQPKFFAALDKLLVTAPIDQWRAYLRFHAIDDASVALAENFRDNYFDFYGKTLSGQPEQEPRWKQVLSAVNGSMGMALGELYVAKTFDPEAKRSAEELVSNIRDALKARIENLDWMSGQTKAKAISKWDKLLPKIGYPDKWRDWSNLTIDPTNYYANLHAASKFNYHYDLSHIGKATDREEWGMTPQTVNAYYDPTTNTINFPAAILQPPFFYAKADDAINYGGIGAVIGHEASHGFDDQGSQFDGDGNKIDWWTPGDKAQFKIRAARLVDQFNGYAPLKADPAVHVNGELTLGENIADLGGLNVAYEALQNVLKKNLSEAGTTIDGYTENQRFFLSWARVWRGSMREKSEVLLINVDSHAPQSIRAMAAPSNMPAFADAFQCKAKDAMVRSGQQQVKIW